MSSVTFGRGTVDPRGGLVCHVYAMGSAMSMPAGRYSTTCALSEWPRSWKRSSPSSM